jgi:hypothetical protein
MNHDYNLPIKAFLLLNKVYPQDGWLTKMKERIRKPIYDIEPHCAGGYDFDKIQTRYHGIPEHLIAAIDHE